MASVIYRPVSVASGSGWSTNPHLAIDEATPSDSDYASCAQNGDVYTYETNLNMSGPTIVSADIISIVCRFRACAVNSSGVPQTPNSGQLVSLAIGGVAVPGSSKSVPSDWTTYSINLTRSQIDYYWPGQDWNSFILHLRSFKQSSTVRTAVSWLEIDFNVSTLPSGLPLYHLLNLM